MKGFPKPPLARQEVHDGPHFYVYVISTHTVTPEYRHMTCIVEVWLASGLYSQLHNHQDIYSHMRWRGWVVEEVKWAEHMWDVYGR